ncbi:EH signature domain-containing protein [Kamptonema sp. UHCC 0994]|uniref:EH signature domain-containing protein n=1 Tax=Kamptonema sp. UHCC 0994 TaxID=3031329 RepID=UPI0023BA911E|nr:EH signature domain-containing protein [Kamptonema sp. UHCC 0994]MDF0556080.1 EH signature domain-containing protein [Kamptonema sp. UHCC 0994]
MKFHFRRLSIPPVSEQQPIKLAELASKLNDPSAYPELDNLGEISATPPRPLDEIFTDIQNGQADRVSLLDWAFCLYNKIDWDRENPTQSRQTSEAIWEESTRNYWLKNVLFWRLALYLSNSNSDNFAPSLADCFPDFALCFADQGFLPVKILLKLSKNESARELAQLSWQHLLTPEELLNTAQLPSMIPTANAALDYIANFFIAEKYSTINQLDLLIKLLNQMSVEQQIRAVETLLSKVPTEISKTLSKLVEWLRLNYGPRTANSLWHQLSPAAKLALTKWIHAASYRDFERLVDVLLAHLNPDNKQHNQLSRRRDFWSNYSERFERIRILLPQESANTLGSHLQRDVDILDDDGSEATEICIFDFGDYFVVEFFRGKGSEIRLFKHHQQPDIEQKLFDSPTLSIKKLRSFGGEVHDHVYLWLTACEKWLRDFGICPNSGTKIFKGLGARYDENTGLPTPSIEQRQDREKHLMRWRWEIEKLEREAKSYCKNIIN